MINNIFKELTELDQVEAIALGGSRSGDNYDDKSDYDVYVYITAPISKEVRKKILNKYCSYMEIGNHYWEYEDNCVLNKRIDIDIIYRNLDDFCESVSDVVEKYKAHNGYTTCMWHNLLNSKIIYDNNKRLEQAKKRFSVPYP
ncbi:MAG: nucleotidyltransferase domain-containing protein, partial [Ruminococcus sp.]|nr:nucleotidyltransferase domain-containing protein [Ruminococcus sp.]